MKTLNKIPFFIIDNSPIKVVSASRAEDFTLTNLEQIQHIRGGFSSTGEPGTFIFEFRNDRGNEEFIEFVYE